MFSRSTNTSATPVTGDSIVAPFQKNAHPYTNSFPTTKHRCPQCRFILPNLVTSLLDSRYHSCLVILLFYFRHADVNSKKKKKKTRGGVDEYTNEQPSKPLLAVSVANRPLEARLCSLSILVSPEIHKTL